MSDEVLYYATGAARSAPVVSWPSVTDSDVRWSKTGEGNMATVRKRKTEQGVRDAHAAPVIYLGGPADVGGG